MQIQKFILQKRLETSEIGKCGTYRITSLLKDLQAIADRHASILGVGREFCIKNNMAWVVINYVIEIDEMPSDEEDLTFETWPSCHEALRAFRDFRILGADGRVMIRAVSQWVMIDLTTRRPIRLGNIMPQYDLLPERAITNPQFVTIDEFSGDADVAVFPIRYDDIDVNQHVNNAVYATWATESLGYEFLDSHKLTGIKINYKKEIPAGEKSILCMSTNSGLISKHAIKSENVLNAYIECQWSIDN